MRSSKATPLALLLLAGSLALAPAPAAAAAPPRRLLGFFDDLGNDFRNLGHTISNGANQLVDTTRQGIVQVANTTVQTFQQRVPPGPGPFDFPPAPAPAPAPLGAFVHRHEVLRDGLIAFAPAAVAAPAPAPVPEAVFNDLGVQRVRPVQSESLRGDGGVVAGK